MSLINPKKIRFSKTLQPFLVGIDAVMMLLFGSQIFKSAIRGNKIIWAFLTFILLIITIKNIRKLILLKRLFKVDAVLGSSEKKEIPVFYISEALGIGEKRTVKFLKKLLKKKFLNFCTLDVEGEPKIIIQLQNESGTDERKLECPSCGTVFTVTAGAVARCPECASIISL